MEDEEIAFKLVELYVREVSQKEEGKQMSLDSILNAYMYSLARLKQKEEEIERIKPIVDEEEEKMEEGLEEIRYPPAKGEEQEDESDMLSE